MGYLKGINLCFINLCFRGKLMAPRLPVFNFVVMFYGGLEHHAT